MLTHRTQVFVTSDWHLGGSLDEHSLDQPSLGSSIFRATSELTDFLDSLTEHVELFEGETYLVLNGDIVDFLAPNSVNGYSPIAWQNDSSIICNELTGIATRFVRSDSRGPFAAVRDLAMAGCKVVVLLGNHDVELCLPQVREQFVDLLGGTANVRLIYDGEAFTCGKLLVEHGNQYDRFNAVNFDMLRRERSQLSRGGKIDDASRGDIFFQPPVGSSIVVDEVNPRLASVPFLNLLKPEFGAAIPLMLALYPETRNFYELLFKAGKITTRALGNTKAKRPGLLAGEASATHSDLNSFLREELAGDADEFVGPQRRPGQLSGGVVDSGSLMDRLAKQAALAIDLTCPWGLYTRLRKGNEKERLNCVRIALKRVRDTADFATDTEKDEYRVPAETMIEQGGFQAVVFGHTHFPKEVEIEGGKYLNTGTWADVLRLPAEISAEDESVADAAIEQFLSDMKNQNYEPHSVRHQSYVRAVVETNGTVEATLQFYKGE